MAALGRPCSRTNQNQTTEGGHPTCIAGFGLAAAKGFVNVRAAKCFARRRLIEKVYDGSAMSLAIQALASGKASKSEIEEARKLLEELEGKS